MKKVQTLQVDDRWIYRDEDIMMTVVEWKEAKPRIVAGYHR